MLTVGSSEKSCFTLASFGCPIRMQIDQAYLARLRKSRSASTYRRKVSTRYLAPMGLNFTERTKK